MSQFNPIAGRTTTLLSTNQLLTSLRRTQASMLNSQEQISSGLQVAKPSDQPADASAILKLQGQIEARGQYEQNLQFALSQLNNTDQALGDAHDIVLEAKGIASSQIGIGSSQQERENQSLVVDAQIQALVQIANRNVQGVALFGGRRSSVDSGPVFIEQLGGIRYVGRVEDMSNDIGLDRPLTFTSNGQTAFGSLSARVKGSVDLDPQATPATRLTHLNGAQNQGVRAGSIAVNVDLTPVIVDLTTAETLGDVVTRVNDAINSVDPTAGSMVISGAGLDFTANPGKTLGITDVGTGQTASDLGIVNTVTGNTAAGLDLDPRLTQLTDLTALGATVNFAGGLKITQGSQTKIADFSAATNIQDMMNTVDQLGLGLRLEINDTATGLNLISEVSGIELSIGENSGGTTAGDLGLRSMGMPTRLEDFNHGLGVSRAVGQDDFAFELHDGTTFNVNIDSATTVAELITTIQAAATGAGLTVGAPGGGGADFNLGLAQDGNGLLFEDNTAGAASFRVVQLGTSLAATDLGINIDAGAGNTITGKDAAKVRVENIFTHMINLRDALVSNDSRGITFAGEGIEEDLSSLSRARADVGVRSRQVEQQQERSTTLKISEQALLSELRDAELTEVITRFTQLQQQLQASLLVGSQNLQLSLLNFLR